MRSISIIFTFLILILFSQLIFSQEMIFDTHSLNLNGELSSEDGYEDNFGRFDAYELSMQEGDFIKIKLKAEFFPLLTVVSPSGSYKLSFPSDNDPEVIYEQEINETGHWYIYVSGDSTDTGTHDLQLYYISANSREIQKGADICTIIQFLLAHSNTNYFYFREKEIEITKNNYDVDLTNQNLFQSADIEVDENRINFALQTDKSISKDKFNEWTYNISKCLANDWKEKSENEIIIFSEINGDRIIRLQFVENIIKLKIISPLK